MALSTGEGLTPCHKARSIGVVASSHRASHCGVGPVAWALCGWRRDERLLGAAQMDVTSALCVHQSRSRRALHAVYTLTRYATVSASPSPCLLSLSRCEPTLTCTSADRAASSCSLNLGMDASVLLGTASLLVYKDFFFDEERVGGASAAQPAAAAAAAASQQQQQLHGFFCTACWWGGLAIAALLLAADWTLGRALDRRQRVAQKVDGHGACRAL